MYCGDGQLAWCCGDSAALACGLGASGGEVTSSTAIQDSTLTSHEGDIHFGRRTTNGSHSAQDKDRRGVGKTDD